MCGAALASAHGNWAAIKWIEIKAKTAKTLIEPTQELLAAIGTNVLADGTSTIQVGCESVKVVSFCGKLQMVAETTAATVLAVTAHFGCPYPPRTPSAPRSGAWAAPSGSAPSN